MSKVKMQTSMGDIVIELNEEKAPITCENFKQYVTDGHYDGTIFHRVINGFMIQGGGFEAGMGEKRTRDPIQNEANNGLSNEIGTIAMARTPNPHSASAQFFINVKNNSFLDFRSESPDGWGYAVFGKVVEGIDVVEQIKAVETTMRKGHQDVPVEDVVINAAEVID
ncbi:MAG: peptidylprolyl isomerase [Gammaproteobacteria bacterium]|nr:peptidylprolyl isomerase [Gammaproteobacteria bacterium]